MNKKILYAVGLVIFSFIPINSLQAQNSVITKLNNFSLCDFNARTGDIENCTEHSGQVVYNKIEVIPNKSITLYFKDPKENGESITKKWDFADLGRNNSDDLFIYKLLEGDMNIRGSMTMTVLMRMDYSVQSLITVTYQNGELLVIKSHGEK